MSTSTTINRPPQFPNPYSGRTLSPSFIGVARGNSNAPPIRHRALFEHAEFGQFAVPAFKKQDEKINIDATAYRVLKSISLGVFVEALWSAFESEDYDQGYIISACSHTTSDPTTQRLEIVFSRLVSKATIARTIIQVGDIRVAPTLAPPARVARFTIRNYAFKSDYRDDTIRILGNYFKVTGEVIKIEAPVFRMGNTGLYLPNHQVVVYTMEDETPEEAGVNRNIQLGSHQFRPVQVEWTDY